MAVPDPKPAKRHRASKEEWDEIRLAKLASRMCRICKRRRATSLHHIVPRSQGGDDRAANLLETCGSGTTGCHGLIEAHDPEAREQLLRSLNVEEIEYAQNKRGLAWLQIYYGL